jgi:predicted DNA-binding transcriptional regulator AlpA
MEIVTVEEVAAMLRISKSKVYELTKDRSRTGELRDNPIPVLKIGSSLRFRKSDIEAWIEKLVENRPKDGNRGPRCRACYDPECPDCGGRMQQP